MNVYKGSFHSDRRWYQVTINDEPFDHAKSLKIRNHSPDGFAWGYAGSGPSQLALAILLEETNKEDAEVLYQVFKQAFIVGLPHEEGDTWELTSKEIQEWLKAKESTVIRAFGSVIGRAVGLKYDE